MAAFEEKIIRLRDLDGDGKADERVVHFSGLNNEVDGLAAGLAWSGGSLFLTCTPGFYRLEDADHAGDRVEAHPLAYGFGIHIGYGGHDMHGALQGPDGRLYWSQGDRGAMVTDDRGVTHANPCQGAVFRIDHCIGAGLGSPDEVVRAAATLAVKSLAYTQALPRLEKSVFDDTAPAEQRISALGALRALNSSQLGKAVRACLQAGDSALRTAALTILAQTEPTSAELPGALDRSENLRKGWLCRMGRASGSGQWPCAAPGARGTATFFPARRA